MISQRSQNYHNAPDIYQACPTNVPQTYPRNLPQTYQKYTTNPLNNTHTIKSPKYTTDI